VFDLFDRTLGHVVTALAWLAGAVVVAMFSLIVVDVSIRTLGYHPPHFTLAVVEYGLLYFAMFSAPYLTRHRGHVVIEAVVTFLPRMLRTVLAHFVYFVCICVALLFAWYSLQLLTEAWVSGDVDVRGVDMPYWILYLPMALCFFLVALEFLRYLIGPYSYYTYDLTEVRDDV
jgi:C4-dicarboxylate transporter, DctQ subunit